MLKSAGVAAAETAVSKPKSIKSISMSAAYQIGANYSVSHSFNASITLRAGESAVYDFNQITTTAVGDPTIADIVPLTKNQLLINAKAPGDTTIIVFDARGKTMLNVVVTPQIDPDDIASKIESAIGNPAVTARAVGDSILLEGTVSTTPEQQRADAIAGAFTSKFKDLIQVSLPPGAPSEAEKYADLLSKNLQGSGITIDVVDEHTISLGGKYAAPIAASHPELYNAATAVVGSGPPDPNATKPVDPLQRLLSSLPTDLRVINLINFETKAPRQILCRAKIIEINKTDENQFGFTWGSSNITGGNLTTTTVNGVTTTTTTPVTAVFNAQPILFTQDSGGAATAGSYANGLLGGGPIHRFLPFAAELNALVAQNKARILSQPSLLVLDGNEGDMMVGGSIPIPTAQANSNAITVTFEPYGIKLSVTPVIVSDTTVQLTVTPEVSSIDNGNGVTVNGTTVPALAIRRVTTTLQMESGQTLVIGGLYSSNDSRNVSEIPFLSKIPVLGEFFKNTNKSKTESELLVLLETEIVTDTTAGIQPPPPGSNENQGIVKPFIGNHAFDGDFPDVDKYIKPNDDDKDKPKDKINLPAVPGTSDNGK
jgi:Flp pilus assembly secretin CpaC